MSDKNNESDLKKYAEDIATIKHMLLEVEEKSIIETWAFFTWGGLLLFGSLLHFLVSSYSGLSLENILIRIWVPVIGMAGFFETIAFFKRMGKEGLPFFSRNAIKLWLSVSAAFIGTCYIVYLSFDLGYVRYVPIFIEVLSAIMMLFYAMVSNMNVFIGSYFLIFASMFHYHFQLTVHPNFIIAGILIGIAFIIAGILVWIQERKTNNE